MKLHSKRAWTEVHLERLLENINQIRSHLSQNTDIMAVVKADAYGHGEKEVCEKLSGCAGIKYFAVSNIDEAISVRKHCPCADILILGYTPAEYATELSQYNIIQGVLSFEHALMLSKMSKEKKIRCHIKIDTGMGRVGLKFSTPHETALCIKKIMTLPNITIEGIYTHLSAADSNRPDDIAYTKSQIDFITDTYDILAENKIKLKHLHFLNSAGAASHYSNRSTLARIGISMYGLLPNYPLPLPYEVKPVMDFKALVSNVKTIHKGDYVSYGRTYCAEKDTIAATVSVGYADGYSRLLSSVGYVLLKGTKCNVIGRICMDQLMIDVSHLENVQLNDVVTLIGKDGNEIITADMLADMYGTIGYETVCGISKRVPRIYVD